MKASFQVRGNDVFRVPVQWSWTRIPQLSNCDSSDSHVPLLFVLLLPVYAVGGREIEIELCTTHGHLPKRCHDVSICVCCSSTRQKGMQDPSTRVSSLVPAAVGSATTEACFSACVSEVLFTCSPSRSYVVHAPPFARKARFFVLSMRRPPVRRRCTVSLPLSLSFSQGISTPLLPPLRFFLLLFLFSFLGSVSETAQRVLSALDLPFVGTYGPDGTRTVRVLLLFRTRKPSFLSFPHPDRPTDRPVGCICHARVHLLPGSVLPSPGKGKASHPSCTPTHARVWTDVVVWWRQRRTCARETCLSHVVSDKHVAARRGERRAEAHAWRPCAREVPRRSGSATPSEERDP